MKRWILAAVVLATVTGCEQMEFSDKKADAEKRWFDARARVLYRVADNRLSTGKLDDAAGSARQALILQPDYYEAKVLMARIDIEQGRYSVAAESLEKLGRIRPKSAELAYLLGTAQEKAGKLTEALANYRRAYALDESSVAAVKAAAEVLAAMGHVRRAQLQVESYLLKVSEDPGMYELAGRLAMMTKEYDKAAEHYERARELDPRNSQYMEMLGRAQYVAGRHAGVIDTLTELLERKERPTGTWVHVMLGDAYLALNKAHQAFEAYFTASERAPNDPTVWVALSRSALAMNDTPRATLAARKALLLEPGQLDATLLLSYALLREGKSTEAVRTLRQAAAAHPTNAMVHCLLGRAHLAAGNEAGAVRCYSAALRMDPTSPLARELLSAAGGGQISQVD